mgnify:CR=1 FL=1
MQFNLKRISEADLILCVGARLGETTTNGYTLLNIPRPTQKLIHVHADPLELGKIYQAQLPINATPKNFAAAVSSIEALNSGNSERISCLASAREDYLETLNPVASAEGANLSEIMKSLIASLPFPLTNKQRVVLFQILKDIERPHAMARMLQ